MYVLWDKRLEKKWCILNLYGSAHEDKKEFLWELAFFCAKCKDPCVVGRDFNILRFSFEKNKAFVPNRFSDMFNSVINAYDLRQIYMFGGFFTWSNNQANPTLERLDSILVSKEWEGMYPTVLVFKKPMEFSNHNPVILDSGSAQACKSREFRFELSWLRQEGFLPKIKEIWLAPTRDRLALNRVMFKLKKVKIFLKGWEYNLAGSRKKRKQNIERMIMVIEEKEESGSIPIELLKRGIDLKVELIKILEEEELHWLKRNHETWLLKGNNNTEFF
jgi:hypothetical protein